MSVLTVSRTRVKIVGYAPRFNLPVTIDRDHVEGTA